MAALLECILLYSSRFDSNPFYSILLLSFLSSFFYIIFSILFYSILLNSIFYYYIIFSYSILSNPLLIYFHFFDLELEFSSLKCAAFYFLFYVQFIRNLSEVKTIFTIHFDNNYFHSNQNLLRTTQLEKSLITSTSCTLLKSFHYLIYLFVCWFIGSWV